MDGVHPGMLAKWVIYELDYLDDFMDRRGLWDKLNEDPFVDFVKAYFESMDNQSIKEDFEYLVRLEMNR